MFASVEVIAIFTEIVVNSGNAANFEALAQSSAMIVAGIAVGIATARTVS